MNENFNVGQSKTMSVTFAADIIEGWGTVICILTSRHTGSGCCYSDLHGEAQSSSATCPGSEWQSWD